MAKLQIRALGGAAALIVGLSPAAALAELPDPVRAMLEAAVASGDKAKVEAVFDVARQTNPDDLAEIEGLKNAFGAEQRELAKAEEARALEELRTAGFMELWSGKGEIGAFRNSGNSDDTGLTAGLALARQGDNWTHKLRGQADFKRANGVTTREQFLASYEPNYRITKRLYFYGLGQYERDRIQGFSGRYVLSGGLGYKIIDGRSAQLSAKAGPAYRMTEYVDGTSEKRLAGLAGFDFNWKITDRLTFTQNSDLTAETGSQAVVVVDSANTSLNLVTGLEAKISDRLSTRLSYAVEYDSDPPAGAVKTDTLTRFTLVYGF